MASTCISNCVKDARVPVRATYVNLYKWPESDVEFIRSLSSNKHKNSTGLQHPKVVDSISCRQLYLRSYTFSRDECLDDDEDEKKGSRTRRIRDSVAETTRRTSRRRRRHENGRSTRGGGGGSSSDNNGGRRRKCAGIRRAKEASCAALAAIFRRLLYCTTKIDVVR